MTLHSSLRSVSALVLSALLAACGGLPTAEQVATSGCLSASQVDDWLAAYNSRLPAANPPVAVTMADAACTRERFQQQLGMRGRSLAVPQDTAGQARLLNPLLDMHVRVVDAQGAALGGGKGTDVLGRPLNAVMWLAQALKALGLALQPGRLVSLGSFCALLPPRPGLRATVHYDGMAGLQPVSAGFH